MKMIRLSSLVIALALGATVVYAEKAPPALPTALQGMTLGEIPAQTAALIAAATPEKRNAAVTELVTGAVKSYPAITTAIVGAVCSKCPEVASLVTKTAVSLQPKQAQLIAKAATAAAPKQTAAITETLAALAEANPSLKPSLHSVLTSLQTASLSVASTTPTSATEATTPTPGRVRGPIVSGPYIPLSGTPTNTPPGNPVPPPGNDYARP
jgi:hypothetical protein